MKKALCFLICCSMCAPIWADNIMYFKDKKSKNIGVKSQSGKIIVPAKYSPLFGYDLGEKITQPFIELTKSEIHVCQDENNPVYAGGDVFDKKGNYLNSPLFFDMGMDNWVEGKRRFVSGCQVGFVNRDNEKIISAQFGFAEPFHYGYSQVIVGKGKKVFYGNDKIHWSLDLGDEQAQYRVINYRGEMVAGSLNAQSPDDIKIGSHYYPKPFEYNDLEKRILKQVNELNVLNELATYGYDNETIPSIQFEIVARPSKYYGYYVLSAFRHQANHEKSKVNTIELVANRQGKVYVHEPFHMNLGKKRQTHVHKYDEYDARQYQALKDWLLVELNKARFYLNIHTDKPHRFDVAKRIREIRALRSQNNSIF